MRHCTPADDPLVMQVDDNEVLVLCVEVGQEGEGEPLSHGQELPDLLVDVDGAEDAAVGEVHRHDVGVA